MSLHYESSYLNLNTHTVVYIDRYTHVNECIAYTIYKYELIHTVKLQVTLYICVYVRMYARIHVLVYHTYGL